MASHAASAEARRVALVIGNGAYEHTRVLPNARNDARVIAALLGKLGFVVSEANDLAYRPMREAIRAFGQAAQGAEMAVVYYAGHGMEVAGENWLVPVSAALKHERDLEYEAVSLSSILAVVKEAKRLRLVVLDACRNNPLGERIELSAATPRSVSRGLARIEPSGDILVAYSAKHGTIAEDGPAGGNSPFAAALALNLGTPGLDVRIMLGKVRDDVRKATGGRQEPFTYGSVGGETIALLPREGPAIAPALPRPVVVQPPQPQVAIGVVPEIKPTVAPSIQAPNEPLPADIPISTDVLRFVEAHPLFSNAPPVLASAYNVESESHITHSRGGKSWSKTNEDVSIQWLRQGIVKTVSLARDTTDTGRTTRHHISIMGANGLISLAHRYQSGTFSHVSRVVRIDNLSGQVFPIQVGNRFSYRVKRITKTSAGHSVDGTTQISCEITRSFEAKAFHSSLVGAAYIRKCEVHDTCARGMCPVSNYQSNSVFFTSLGLWIEADPVLPRERIIENATARSDKQGGQAFSTVTIGTYTLKSFSLAR